MSCTNGLQDLLSSIQNRTEILLMTTDRSATLVEAWWPASDNALIKGVVMAILGSLLLTISAKIKVPLGAVPMTMQLFVVLALSLALGARLGTAAVALYLAQGAMGFPVFAGTPDKGIGLAYMMGTTGGYLAGYLVAAAITGWLADRGFSRTIPLAFLAATAGAIAIYGLGVLWLGTLLGWDKPILAWGLWPFLAPDAVKVALVALAVPAAWKLTVRR